MARSPNALKLLERQHREVQSLFHRYERAPDERSRARLCADALKALKEHAAIEEEVFYPFVRESTAREELMEEAVVEHATAKQLMAELERGAEGVHQRAVMKVLAEYMAHHIREEEEQIFPLVEKLGVDLEALGEEMAGMPASKPGRRTASTKKPAGLKRGAKWIESPDEHADRPGQTLATRNPEVIRQWARARKAKPATTASGDPDNPRVLRFDFPDYGGGSLRKIDWDAWLRTFRDRDLVFLYQERMKRGNPSNFFRFDNPRREDA